MGHFPTDIRSILSQSLKKFSLDIRKFSRHSSGIAFSFKKLFHHELQRPGPIHILLRRLLILLFTTLNYTSRRGDWLNSSITRRCRLRLCIAIISICNEHPICTSEHVKTLTTTKISKSCLFGAILQVMWRKKCNDWLFTLTIGALQKSCGAMRPTSSSGASQFCSVAKKWNVTGVLYVNGTPIR